MSLHTGQFQAVAAAGQFRCRSQRCSLEKAAVTHTGALAAGTPATRPQAGSLPQINSPSYRILAALREPAPVQGADYQSPIHVRLPSDDQLPWKAQSALPITSEH